MRRAVQAGERVARWTALHHDRRSYWVARCAEKSVNWSSVRRGDSQSCGCYKRDKGSPNRRHGESHTPLWNVWAGMRRRCEDTRCRNFADYGGRGVTVCDRWQSYEAFRDDMGGRYTTGLQLDRIDNDGPYSPENCRWADAVTQANNRRNNVLIETPWGKLSVTRAAKRAGLSPGTVWKRHNQGWPANELLAPLRRRLLPTPWGELTIGEAARRAGVKPRTVSSRLHKGWTPSRALGLT